MISFKKIIDDIFIIISKKQTLFEFLLNFSFVLIIFAIATLLYWDNINRSIITNNRCKISIDNEDLTYNLKVYNPNKENANIFDISYDNTNEKNVKIDCSCPVGETVNKFKIPYYDKKDEKIRQVEKYCYCNKDYKYELENLKDLSLDGDAFLIDYYDKLYDKYSYGNVNY
jgi:hypothetical protein